MEPRKLVRARTAGVRKVVAIERGTPEMRRGITVIRDDELLCLRVEAETHIKGFFSGKPIKISKKVLETDEV